MPHPKFQADLLIFDLDGTLVDTRRDLAQAVNFALQQMGREEIDLATVTSYVGDGIRKLLERALGTISDREIEIAHRHFRQFYLAHIADYSQPYPGIEAMLEHFANTPKAVLTNKPQEFTDALLQKLDLRRHFAIVIGGQPQLKLKPDPEAVFKILNHCAISPARAMMIGDGENDILAGKAAGIKTCAVTYGLRPAEKLIALGPDIIIEKALHLKNMISKDKF